ncbi:MFS transporter, partial [Bacillus altitudinis]|nr:MFS transporter [Bacillus altitudinis]
MLDTEQDVVKYYIDSPQKLKKLSQRVVFVVSLSPIFGGAGIAAGITVG